MSVVAVAVVGAAVVGGVVASSSADKAAAAQDRATESQKSIQQQQLDMAREQYNHYKTTYQPLEDEFANEARDYGSEANRQKAAGDAAGNVTSSYANLRQQLNSTPGLDPSSQTYQNLMVKLGVSEAGQKAAAETGARNTVDAQGAAREQDAISMGKGLSSNATASLNGASVSASALGQLGINGAQIAGQQAAGIGRAIGGIASDPSFRSAVGGWFSSGPTMDNSYAPINEPAVAPSYGGAAGDVAATLPAEGFPV